MNSGKGARTAVRSERKSLTRQRRRLQDRMADLITGFAGSMAFVYLHVAWFAAWIVMNVTGWHFDPFPFGLLTLIVSLEAIFLSTFVMIGQNRQSAFQQAKADHDFNAQELELKTNTELTREIHTLTMELHRRLMSGNPSDGGAPTAAT